MSTVASHSLSPMIANKLSPTENWSSIWRSTDLHDDMNSAENELSSISATLKDGALAYESDSLKPTQILLNFPPPAHNGGVRSFSPPFVPRPSHHPLPAMPRSVATPPASSSTAPHPAQPSLSSSGSSTVSQPALSAAERKRRRVEKHRVVDAVRRTREARALSSLLEVLREEQLAQERVEKKRPKSTTQPRSRAQVLETAVTRLRSMRALLSAQESASPPPHITLALPTVSSSSSSSSSFTSLTTTVRASTTSSLTKLDSPSDRYESLFRRAPDHTILFLAHTRTCVDVSDEFCSYSGYPTTQVIGTVVDLCPFSPTSQLADYGVIDCNQRGHSSKAVECVPSWQVSLNRQQLSALFEGKERRVQCLFRLVLSDQSQVDGWFRCWTVGQLGSPSQLLVLQTNAESYLAAA